jgi:alpha,alpha-trehalase
LDPWILVYDGFEPEKEGLHEALCTLGNGYFATRGAVAESEADIVHYPGTYLAGGYNRLKTEISGRTVENEDLVNLPNWLPLNFRIADGDWFDPKAADLLDYRQELHIYGGILHRMFRFQDGKGRITKVRQRRLVHMGYQHIAGLQTTVTAENWTGIMEFRSALDGRIRNLGVRRYRKLKNRHIQPLGEGFVDKKTMYLKVQTNQSEIRIALAGRTGALRNGREFPCLRKNIKESGYVAQDLRLNLNEGEETSVEKIVALYTSRDNALSECGERAIKILGGTGNFSSLAKSHSQIWHQLWKRFDIKTEKRNTIGENRNRMALILHLHLFHLLQTASVHTMDLDVGVPARGWHGEAYRGHIFWDELFVFPILNLQMPNVTRALLNYRYRRLPEARRAAENAGYRGAMYPWQSGSDGREETQQLHLNPESGHWNPDNSQLQRHVNAAIAYNIWRYWQVTRDSEFMAFYGAEMMLEIARFWASIAQYNSSLERYEIKGIMGPDEYHDRYPGADKGGLDNNAYTNLMAVWVLCRAMDVLEMLCVERKDELTANLNLTSEETDLWQDISRKMRLVFHGDGIISQFEGYDQLKEFEWDKYRERYGNIQRLDRILELEDDDTNHYQVSKQADVLMLFYLFSSEELRTLFDRIGYKFEGDCIPKNIDYYLKRTSDGSTLSKIVHSWVLARSDRPKSWSLFKEALESDISDVQGGTTPEGIHLGAMSGTVDYLQRGATGIETRDDVLWLNPQLPQEVDRIQMRIRYRGYSLELRIDSEEIALRTLPCNEEAISIGFLNRIHRLGGGEMLTISYKSEDAPAELTGPAVEEA